MKKLVKGLRWILLALWCIAMAVAGMWVLSENTQPVSVTLLGFPLAEYTLGIVMCSALLIGLLLGFLTSALTSWGRAFWQGRKYRAASREIDRLKRQSSTENA